MQGKLAIKVGLLTALLSIGLTSGGLYIFYDRSARILTEQITRRLRDLANLANLKITPQEQQAIEYLTQQSLNKLAVSEAQISTIGDGEFLPGLPTAESAELMQSPQFQGLVQFLRTIEYAPLPQTSPRLILFPQLDSTRSQLAAYLFVPSPQPAVVMFVADSRFAPDGDWTGNPVGNLYHGPPIFLEVFKGQTQISNIYQDDFGTWLTAIVPLKDDQGRVYAALGIDYDLSSEANQLRILRFIGLGILSGSLVLAVLLSLMVTRWLEKPLTQLQDAAARVKARDFSVVLSINSKDELGFLAQAFNDMVTELGNYAEGLENKVAERTQELKNANQEIQDLNERLRGENLRMAGELAVSRKLQQMILPKDSEFDHIANLDIAGYMEPATEVGGDYYDILQNDGKLTIGIGDVTGHGLESGVLMLMAQTAVRTLQAANIVDYRRFMTALNQTLYGNIQRMNSDKNMTLAVLEYDQGALTLFGQHEEMIIIRQNGTIERIDTCDLGFPLGLEEHIDHFVSKIQIKLEKDDIVVLYTDGIVEAENPQKQMYGLDRLCEIVQGNRHQPARAIRSTLIEDLSNFISDRTVFDDVTLIILKQA